MFELNHADLDRWLTTPPDEYGFEMDYLSACGGFGCVDGCGDCITSTVLSNARGCEWCYITHDTQHCPSILAVLFADDIPDIPDIEPGNQTPGGPPPPEWRTRQ